jgi:ribosome recycling factor
MENVSDVLNDATAKIAKSFDALKAQFSGLRTGKASPAMVDQIKVDYYGCPTPIKNLGTISTPEPRQIKIAPFDPTVLDAINKAILAANIGVTPQSDGKVLRITVPELNEERRKEIVKVAKTQAEAQKVAMRNVRRDANDECKQMKKNAQMTEDEQKTSEKQIQDLTDSYIKKVDAITAGKVKEIMEI